MSHDSVWFSHPRKYGKGSRQWWVVSFIRFIRLFIRLLGDSCYSYSIWMDYYYFIGLFGLLDYSRSILLLLLYYITPDSFTHIRLYIHSIRIQSIQINTTIRWTNHLNWISGFGIIDFIHLLFNYYWIKSLFIYGISLYRMNIRLLYTYLFYELIRVLLDGEWMNWIGLDWVGTGSWNRRRRNRESP